jgi:hypothetical protein
MGDQRTDDVIVAAPQMMSVTAVAPTAHRPWGTVWVWLLAFMPWLVAACTVLAIVSTLATWLSVSLPVPEGLWVPLLVVPYLLGVTFAALDALQLRARQHPTVASWTWGFLGAPVYLVARSLTLEPRAPGSLRPMWTGLINMVLATLITFIGLGTLAAVVAYFFTLLANSYAEFGY